MKKNIAGKFLIRLVLTFLLAHCQTVFSQVEISRNGKYLEFEILKTNDENLKIQDILNNKYEFISPADYVGKTNPKDIFWIKIDFQDELVNIAPDSTWYLKTPGFSYASIINKENDSIVERKFGRFENLPRDRSLLRYPAIEFDNGSLFEDRFLFLKVKRILFFDSPVKWKISYRSGFKEQLLKEFYNKRDLNTLVPIYIFTGICLIMFVLTLTYFLYSKRLEFLYYTIYVLCLFLYLSSDVFGMHELLFGKFSFISYTFFFEMQVAINLAYILFVIHYLQTKSYYPKLHVALRMISYFLISVIIIDIFLLATGFFSIHIHLLNIERLVMTAFGLIGMSYLLIRSKNKLAYFVVIGSFCYMFGALGLLFFGNRLYMITGSAIEIVVFAAGLTYKVQNEYKERMSFETEANLNRNKALRAQINPHFIFNSLSSLQHLVDNGERNTTLKYLSRFSRLMRNVLESSMDTNVLLTEEIKMLEDYLELESLRFPDSFSYELEISPSLDIHSIEIPFMLTQPFVENAIVHGLLPKREGSKLLRIKFGEQDDMVLFEVDDNGVGRDVQKKGLKTNNPRKSRGLEITKQRIQNMGHDDVPIRIIDKKDTSGLRNGTRVVVTIPIN